MTTQLDPESMRTSVSELGSGGVARNLFDSPAARELRDVLGGDNVQVGAIYPYNEAEAKKAKEITHRMDSAWAQTADPDINTIKLREWAAVTNLVSACTASSPTRRSLQSWRWWPKSTRSVG